MKTSKDQTKDEIVILMKRKFEEATAENAELKKQLTEV